MTSRLLALGLFGVLAAQVSAADAKPIKIRWFGQSFFVLESSAGTKVAFDPHAIDAYGRPVVAADAVCVSHLHNDHTQFDAVENQATAKKFVGISGQGNRGDWVKIDEQFKDIHLRSVGLYHDRVEGMKSGKVSAFVVEVDGLRVVHLGDLGHELTTQQARQIGPVDVLMIPAGGVYTLNGTEAKAVVAKLKPRLCVLPMHYGTNVYQDLPPPDEFLDETPNVRRLKTNEIQAAATDTTTDPPVVFLLQWKGK